MIFDVKNKFCFLANSKCASTAIEMSIPFEPHHIRFHRNPFKHTNFRQFRSFCGIYGDRVGAVETCCIVRHPLERASSWYRYRQRAELSNPSHPSHGRFTGSITFDEFIEECIRNGDEISQIPFVTDDAGKIAVDYVFSYKNINDCVELLKKKLGLAFELPVLNASPKIQVELGDGLRERFFERFDEEIEVYEKVNRSGVLRKSWANRFLGIG